MKEWFLHSSFAPEVAASTRDGEATHTGIAIRSDQAMRVVAARTPATSRANVPSEHETRFGTGCPLGTTAPDIRHRAPHSR